MKEQSRPTLMTPTSFDTTPSTDDDDDTSHPSNATTASLTSWHTFITPPRRRNISSSSSSLRRRPLHTFHHDEASAACSSRSARALSPTDETATDILRRPTIQPQIEPLPMHPHADNCSEQAVAPLLSTTSTSSHAPKGRINRLLRRLEQRRLVRRQAAYERMQQRNSMNGMKCWIPVDHPLKLLWDMCTVICSALHAYLTHRAIRDRNFEFLANNYAAFKLLLELWFVVDILLHFVTEHAIGKDMVLRTVRAVSARYLTTWFVVDVLSLVPGEWLFVRPIVARYQAQRRWHKWWRRSRAVSRVTGVLLQRWSTVQSASRLVQRQSGRAGVARLVRTLIQYLPKYLLVWRHMKAVVAIRLLRQWHWMRKMYYSNSLVWTWMTTPRASSITKPATAAQRITTEKKSFDFSTLDDDDDDDATNSLTFQGEDDEDDHGYDEEDDDEADLSSEEELLDFLKSDDVDDEDGRRVVLFENEDSFLFDPDHMEDDDDGNPY